MDVDVGKELFSVWLHNLVCVIGARVRGPNDRFLYPRFPSEAQLTAPHLNVGLWVTYHSLQFSIIFAEPTILYTRLPVHRREEFLQALGPVHAPLRVTCRGKPGVMKLGDLSEGKSVNTRRQPLFYISFSHLFSYDFLYRTIAITRISSDHNLKLLDYDTGTRSTLVRDRHHFSY